MGGHDELDCITAACGMYQQVLNDADVWSENIGSDLDPETELREQMPRLIATLSPEARAALRDHLDHVRELVAHVHRMTAAYADANRSSA